MFSKGLPSMSRGMNWDKARRDNLVRTRGSEIAAPPTRHHKLNTRSAPRWKRMANYCLKTPSHFKPHETKFLHDILARDNNLNPSHKQIAWLSSLYARVWNQRTS